MHPRIAELTQYVDQQRSMLTAAVGQVAAARHRESPGMGRWSVVNVIEHVAIVEKRIGGNLGTWIAEERAKGLPRETDPSPILPSINTERFSDRSRPVKTSPAAEPTGIASIHDAMTALGAAGTAFREAIAQGDGYALGTVVRPHGGLGPLTLYEWIAFVGGHMTRHALQIREIGLQLAQRGAR